MIILVFGKMILLLISVNQLNNHLEIFIFAPTLILPIDLTDFKCPSKYGNYKLNQIINDINFH
jgi:hypothetical protein